MSGLLKRKERNAINDGRLKFVKNAINRMNVNYKDRAGLTPLEVILAQKNPDKDTINYLVSIGADLTKIDPKNIIDPFCEMLKGDFNVDMVSTIVALDIDLNSYNRSQELPLQLLLNKKKHNYYLIKLFIAHGAKPSLVDINTQSSDNQTLMKHLLRERNPKINLIKHLQASGAIIEERAFQQVKEFEEKNNMRVLEQSLNFTVTKGYDITTFFFWLEEQLVQYNLITINNKHILHYLCSLQSLPITLISNVVQSGRIDINGVNYDEETALNLVFEKSNPNLQLIQFLIQSGSSINPEQLLAKNFQLRVSPFYNLLKNSDINIELLAWLNSKGIPLTTTFHDQKNVLHMLTEREDIDSMILEYLINEGVEINGIDDKLNTPLHYLCMSTPVIEKIQLLILHGSDFNYPNKEKFTPFQLLYTRLNINTQILLFALENGAILESINPQGLSVLSAVCRSDNVDHQLVNFLIKQGSNLNSEDQFGNSPLHYYINNEIDLQNVRLMVEKGANINAMNHKQNTPLHELTKKYDLNEQFVDFLLEHNADFSTQNKDYQTPLSLSNNLTSKIIADQIKNFQEKKSEKKIKNLANELKTFIKPNENTSKVVNTMVSQPISTLSNEKLLLIETKYEKLEKEFSQLKFNNTLITELQKESSEKSKIINQLLEKVLDSEKKINEMKQTITKNEDKIHLLQNVVQNNSYQNTSQLTTQLNEWKQRVAQLLDENGELKTQNKQFRLEIQKN
ncbi:ankyrin repeat-containing protein [Anaeramoeba flamelloides]|uniref:Ankyrin repeat-containing protein n=1 Tax=Anaeramoeba flamelloides TaxID=1746091 RepID=A0ABQ8Y5K8_9EUKA|nr:ankyrin repeat-containing protein [Anaeramoeba flamelloides]